MAQSFEYHSISGLDMLYYAQSIQERGSSMRSYVFHTTTRYRLLFTLVLVSLTMGCGSSLMMDVEPLGEPPADEAIVTFLRPSIVGGAIRFGLWDGENLIGVSTSGSLIEYKTKPGEHLFLARSENWSLVKANLAAGKKYYVMVRPQFGIIKWRVHLDPATKPNMELDNALKKCQPIAPIPEKVDAYVNARLEHVREAIDNYKKGKAKAKEIVAADGS